MIFLHATFNLTTIKVFFMRIRCLFWISLLLNYTRQHACALFGCRLLHAGTVVVLFFGCQQLGITRELCNKVAQAAVSADLTEPWTCLGTRWGGIKVREVRVLSFWFLSLLRVRAVGGHPVCLREFFHQVQLEKMSLNVAFPENNDAFGFSLCQQAFGKQIGETQSLESVLETGTWFLSFV